MHASKPVIISGTSNLNLAYQISEALFIELGEMHVGTFPDGEISVQILENVRGRDVFVVQSIARKPNFYLMELLIMMDALKRASAKSITVVIPYLGYARQDRKDKPRVPVTAKLVADLIQCAGATRVLTMDLHAEQIQGFFDVPVDNMKARGLLVKEIKSLQLEDTVVVAPDVGSSKLARSFALQLGTEYAVVEKLRQSAEEVKVTTVIGDVEGKSIILVDDVCSTGSTLVSAARLCLERGAKEAYAAVTHGLFVGKAAENLKNCPIKTLFVTNTIDGIEEMHLPKVKMLSSAPLFAEGIRCVMDGRSLASFTEPVPL